MNEKIKGWKKLFAKSNCISDGRIWAFHVLPFLAVVQFTASSILSHALAWELKGSERLTTINQAVLVGLERNSCRYVHGQTYGRISDDVCDSFFTSSRAKPVSKKWTLTLINLSTGHRSWCECVLAISHIYFIYFFCFLHQMYSSRNLILKMTSGVLPISFLSFLRYAGRFYCKIFSLKVTQRQRVLFLSWNPEQ